MTKHNNSLIYTTTNSPGCQCPISHWQFSIPYWSLIGWIQLLPLVKNHGDECVLVPGIKLGITGSADKPTLGYANYDTTTKSKLAHKLNDVKKKWSRNLCRGSFASVLLKRYGRRYPRLFMIGQMKRRRSSWIEDPSPPGKDGRPLSIYYNELVAIFQEFDHQNASQRRYSWRSHSTRSVDQWQDFMFIFSWVVSLDPKYDQVPEEILRKDPNLDLESSYAYVWNLKDLL